VKITKIAILESYEKRNAILLAYLRFAESVNDAKGSSEKEKFIGGDEAKGVLDVIMSYV